jgi:hypothetical protein
VKLGDALELAPMILVFAGFFVAGRFISRHNPAWLLRWREIALERTRLYLFVSAAVGALISALLMYVSRGLGMFLEFRVTGVSLHIPYFGWLFEMIFAVIIASASSFLYPSKEDEPVDWLDRPKDDLQPNEEA